MAYQALYRKYRLKTFDDMVGQEHISNTISNAILSGKISHAYLFAGPRGTGKTSIAKLIARAVNCTGDGVLCGSCDMCRSILNNETSDIIEIDAASNNGVDEIRDIKDKVKYAPSLGKYKVYIIDEVHMLTTQAFNALLKTLEEPPSHVIFILATTEPHKLPLTILSRCQRFDFRNISETCIVKRLKLVVDKENIDITENALKLIAYLSDGGMRDALSLLDQASSYLDKTIDEEDVYLVTGVASKDAVEDVLKGILSGDHKQVLLKLSQLSDEGKDLYKLCDSVSVYLRDGLVNANGIDNDTLYNNSETFLQVKNLGIDTIYEMIKFLSEVAYKMKLVNNVKIFLEVSILKLIDIAHNNHKIIVNQISDTDNEKVEEQFSATGALYSAEETIEEVSESQMGREEEIVSNDIIEEKLANNIEEQVLEEDEEVVIDSQMERKYNNHLRGVRINNALSKANKNILNERKVLMEDITNLDVDMDDMHIKSILTGAVLRVSSSTHMIISVKSEVVVAKIMEELAGVESMIKAVVKEDVKVAAISEKEWVRIKGEYIERLNVGKSYSEMEEQTINEYFGIADKGKKAYNDAIKYFGVDITEVEE